MFHGFCETFYFLLEKHMRLCYNLENYNVGVYILNLKRIELHGFKSFADKTVIPLKDGFTAIIGPNGCGKSNVAEAIRWTLGEQSAKSLRGKSMTDVIFAGTEKRRSMSYSEVTLVFDNEGQKIFPNVPFDEVSIGRKLDRSGLSEYYVNNTRCRMKDIIGMLHDTGIGKEGYSIIGQGRIDEILSAKPEDRRNIFEEAAGISKFRAQRVEAERKLEKTSLNLQTANEVIAEIERQLVPLRRQAETAKKYFALKDALKKQEVNLYIYNYENNETIKKKIYDRIDESNSLLKVKEMAYNGAVMEYDKTLRENAALDETVAAENAELLSLKVGAERMAGEVNVLKERISNLQSEEKRLNEELKSVDASLVISADLIRSSELKKEEVFRDYLAVSKEYENADSRLKLLSRSIEGGESDLETKNAEYINAMRELGELRSNSSSYLAEKSVTEERAKNLLALINEKKAKLDEENTNLSIYDSNVKKFREDLRATLQEFNENQSNKLEAQEAIKSINEDEASLNNKIAYTEGQLKLAIAAKNEYAGYGDAVQRLMKDAKYDPMLQSKILGVMAEVLVVPKEYESAIEFALGGNMQNILVETERDAGALITHLKQKNYGRATFRPRTACRRRSLQGYEREALHEQGCLGVAADLVSYEPKFDDFVSALLGNVVIVDNMLSAERIWKKYDRAFKIVTLDGEVYAKGGEVTGGSRRTSTSGLLSQEAQIDQFKNNLDRLARNIKSLRDQRDDRLREIELCEEKVTELNARINDLRIELTLNEDKSKNALELVETLTKEISAGAGEYEIAKERVKDLSDRLSSIDELEALVQSRGEEYHALVSLQKTESGERKSERDSLSEEVMNLRIKMTETNNVLTSVDADIFRHKREASNLEQEKLDLIADLKSVQVSLDSILSAPEKTAFSAEDAKRIKELEESISSLSDKKKQLSDRIIELDSARNRLLAEKTEISEKKIRDEGMLDRIDDENRMLQEHILEEYDLTYSSALEFKDEEFVAHGAKTAISDLKKEISHLGNVNPLAVETLEETEKRHDEQVVMRDDIQAAYEDIFKIIEELTTEMTGKFVSAFEKIQVNFKDVFTKLFGGGKGELRLDTSETDDPLEAGIEIYAQPPGKTLKHITLLSGGERAVTAIAILFSILSLKPMPFCVLDEIDAALDESNANLFAEFITKFSDYTQFIVITHRKPTMRHADSIFGVTMEEKGVTKTVGIEFEDALKVTDGEDDGDGLAVEA